MKGDNMESCPPMAKRPRTAKTDAMTKCRRQLRQETMISNGAGGKSKKCPDESVGRVSSEEYLVENIVDTKIKDGVREYRVKWLGWDSSFNSWEPEENVAGCLDLVKEFWKESKIKAEKLTVALPKSATVSKNVPTKKPKLATSAKSIQYKIKGSNVTNTPIFNHVTKARDKIITATNEASLRPDTELGCHLKPNISHVEPKNGTSGNELIKHTGYGLHRRLRVVHKGKDTVFTINPDDLLNVPDDFTYDFVVTTKVEGRNILRYYSRTIENAEGHFVLCEFEGCNLLEVIPVSCAKILLKNPPIKTDCAKTQGADTQI